MKDKISAYRLPIKKYLLHKKKLPKLAIILIVVGILTSAFAIGIPLFLTGLIWLLLGRKGKTISDLEFDVYFKEDMFSIRNEAREKLRITPQDEIGEPQMIISPAYKGYGNAFFGLKKGRDGKLRYSPVNIALIFFTEMKLVTYQCAFDLTTGNHLNYSTRKFYYNEIVAIETQSDTLTLKREEINQSVLKRFPDLTKNFVNGNIQINHSEKFTITSRGGNTLEIQLPDSHILGQNIDGTIPTSMTDAAVAAIETMVDDKRLKETF